MGSGYEVVIDCLVGNKVRDDAENINSSLKVLTISGIVTTGLQGIKSTLFSISPLSSRGHIQEFLKGGDQGPQKGRSVGIFKLTNQKSSGG